MRLAILGGKAADGGTKEAPAAKRKLTPKTDRDWVIDTRTRRTRSATMRTRGEHLEDWQTR